MKCSLSNIMGIISIILIIFYIAFLVHGNNRYDYGYKEGFLNGSTQNETNFITEINVSVNLSNFYENMNGVNFYNYKVKFLDEFERPIGNITSELLLMEEAEITSNERYNFKEIDKCVSNKEGDCIFESIPAKDKCFDIWILLELEKTGIEGLITVELCGNKTEEYYVSKEEGVNYKYILITELKGVTE